MIEKPWLPFHEYRYKGKKINLPIIHKDNLIEEKKVLVEDKELLFNSQEAIEHKTPNWIKQRELLQKITKNTRKKGGGRTLKIRRRKKKKTKRKGKKKDKYNEESGKLIKKKEEEAPFLNMLKKIIKKTVKYNYNFSIIF